MKRSSKTGYKKNLYLYIYSYILEHGKLPQDIPKTNRQYYINKLVKEGFIHKLGYAVWVADREKKYKEQGIKKFKKQGKVGNIRGHGFHWKISIPKISNWNSKEEYLIKHSFNYKKHKLGYFRINIKDYKIWLCNESIIFYTPRDRSFYAGTADKAYLKGFDEMLTIVAELEKKLNTSLKWANGYHIKASKQHYAKIQDSLAKHCNENKEHIRAYYNDKQWLVIDNSLNLNELETVHPENSKVDMDKVVIPFFNDLKQHYESTGESLKVSDMLKLFKQQQEVINSILLFNENQLKLHELNKDQKQLLDYVG